MPPATFPVTLQISLAPGDHRLAEKLLAHQVEFWRRGVDEILLSIDTRRSPGRFGEDWKKGRRRIIEIVAQIPGARVIEIDYSRESRHAIADEFFGDIRPPSKDWRGGPTTPTSSASITRATTSCFTPTPICFSAATASAGSKPLSRFTPRTRTCSSSRRSPARLRPTAA